MTDPDELEEEPLAEQEIPVEVGPGCFVFRDWDYLDPASQVTGVIGIQVDESGGVWRLVGSGEGDTYCQTFEAVGKDAPKRRIRPVN